MKTNPPRRNFVRRRENFVCEHCGTEVTGDGYTDHCPQCLWGKHVDDQIPGDRAAECRALMEPMETSYEKGEFRIFYRCTGCKHTFTVWANKDDNRELLVQLTSVSGNKSKNMR